MTKIEEYINSLPYHFYFLEVDKYLGISLPELINFTTISPQSLGIELSQKNSGKLLSHPLCIQFIKQKTQEGRTPVIVPFKPSAKVDIICQQQNWLKASNPGKLNRFLEDKIQFTEFLDNNDLPSIPHKITTLTKENFELLQQEFGKKLVIQTHFGWAGNSSYLAENWDEISAKVNIGTTVKAMPFWTGYSLINNCCITSSGLVQSPPGLQYTGIPELTTNPLATAGRQWPSNTTPHINQQVFDITQKLGDLLAQKQYRGFFGIDFFVHEDRVYIIECNPRLTASFAFYTEVEKKNSIEPLFYYHLLSYVRNEYQLDVAEQNNRFYNQNIIGSELTLKNATGATINKYHDFVEFTKTNDPADIESKYIHQVLK